MVTVRCGLTSVNGLQLDHVIIHNSEIAYRWESNVNCGGERVVKLDLWRQCTLRHQTLYIAMEVNAIIIFDLFCVNAWFVL